VALFATGRGTGIGRALGPLTKVGSNSPRARVNGDMDADTILERKQSTEEVDRKIFQERLDVASGCKLTRAEQAS
jgi:altronate dehydratase